MKRYKCTVFDERGEFGECMERHEEGRYVTHESASKKIAKLEKEVRGLQVALSLPTLKEQG